LVFEWAGCGWRDHYGQRLGLRMRRGRRVLFMNGTRAAVAIVGAPIACAEGMKETWRELARWAAGQMHTRYGDQVEVSYFDLFDPACPHLPPDAQLPVVLVNDQVVINGGKLSVPVICRHVETLGVRPMAAKPFEAEFRSLAASVLAAATPLPIHAHKEMNHA